MIPLSEAYFLKGKVFLNFCIFFIGLCPIAFAENNDWPVQSIPTNRTEVSTEEDQVMALISSRVSQLVQTKDDHLFLQEMDEVINQLDLTISRLVVPRLLVAEPELKAFIDQELFRLEYWWFDRFVGNQTLYFRLKKVRRRPLQHDEKRLLNKLFSCFDFVHDVDSPEEFSQIMNLSRTLEALENQFERNIEEAEGSLNFSADELDGLPQEFLKKLPKNGKRYEIRSDIWWQYATVMRRARSARTRKLVETSRQSLAQTSNSILVDTISQLRFRLAKALGYSSWADHQLGTLILPTENKLQQFLSLLLQENKSHFKKEKVLLSAEKARQNKTKTAALKSYDVSYYMDQYIRNEIGLDQERLHAYLPYPHVLRVIFDQIKTTFGVEFKKASPPISWGSHLQFFELRDVKSGKKLGGLFIDPYPRRNKDSWFFSYTIANRKDYLDGSSQLPLNVIALNLTPPGPGKPSLLDLEEVRTIAHELGHSLHALTSTVGFSLLAGYNSGEDLVETPSTFMESWLNEASFVKKLGKHYKTGNSFSDRTVQKILQANHFGEAHQLQDRLINSLLDLKLHGSEVIPSADQLERQLRSKYGYKIQLGASPVSSFSYLVGGYSSLYWIYILGSVLGNEFQSSFEGSVFDARSGLRYRNQILSQGGRFQTPELLKNYFGQRIDICKRALEQLR